MRGNSPEKNYLSKGWIAVTVLIAVLVAVSFVPPQTIGNIELRRANILSDIVSFDDTKQTAEESGLFDEADFDIDMQQVAQQLEAVRVESGSAAENRVQITYEWSMHDEDASHREITPDSALLNSTLVEIEDHSDNLRRFYDTLLYAQRPVRIAVFGDSFIEGDILTADLREKLQLAYGGGGAGFAPVASPLTAFRRSIKTTSKGWSTYNIMQRKTAPAELSANFFVSGWVSRPGVGASTRWESSDFRQKLDAATAARIFFISPADSRIEVVLNDSLRREFTVAGASAVRQIVVEAPVVRSLSFKVLSGIEGFIGYGAIFEAKGVVVDNYSVRSNNGQALFWTNPSVNAQINALAGYDLVILQYGLNIMQAGVRNYSNYATQIEKMVEYVRQCFPTAAVLVLGVSDRSINTESGFEPMDAIPYMLDYQRRAAQNSGTAFWSVRDAMISLGGMKRFVANGWAGKDFTHINYAGGRRVAWSLFDALNAGALRVYEQTEGSRIRREEHKAIIDSLLKERIDRELRLIKKL